MPLPIAARQPGLHCRKSRAGMHHAPTVLIARRHMLHQPILAVAFPQQAAPPGRRFLAVVAENHLGKRFPVLRHHHEIFARHPDAVRVQAERQPPAPAVGHVAQGLCHRVPVLRIARRAKLTAPGHRPVQPEHQPQKPRRVTAILQQPCRPARIGRHKTRVLQSLARLQQAEGITQVAVQHRSLRLVGILAHPLAQQEIVTGQETAPVRKERQGNAAILVPLPRSRRHRRRSAFAVDVKHSLQDVVLLLAGNHSPHSQLQRRAFPASGQEQVGHLAAQFHRTAAQRQTGIPHPHVSLRLPGGRQSISKPLVQAGAGIPAVIVFQKIMYQCIKLVRFGQALRIVLFHHSIIVLKVNKKTAGKRRANPSFRTTVPASSPLPYGHGVAGECPIVQRTSCKDNHVRRSANASLHGASHGFSLNIGLICYDSYKHVPPFLADTAQR